MKKQLFFRLLKRVLLFKNDAVGQVFTRMAWTDRKVAVRIPARSARDILVAGRFALPSMPSAFKRWRGLFENMFNAACLHLF
ncbi:MAG: hypothetical protein E6Z83_16535 [Pantoea sp.]|uniref:Uncharacterized protein n=1 Tax=Pantoea septica TaxID=472695 RepID=A0ABX3UTI3_9GAMM|nr:MULTISPECIES: hypothetical protein [Pantoea]MDU5782392.1 hypothetical protein [Pantoea sp.]MDU6434305.1 hypothetical protein [Pantoea sp.]ORN00348.1 hypothetical protein HA46_08160 [Pantoea septica]